MAPDEPVLLAAPTPWGVRLTLNRPASLNALSGELVAALDAAIVAAAADPAVRVIVIEGAGRAFSSGYDLTEGGRCRARSPGAASWLPMSR